MKSGLIAGLRLKLGEYEHKRGSDEYDFECPRCTNGKKKLGVNPSKGMFHCFRCKWSGRIADLLREMEMDVGDFAPDVWKEPIRQKQEEPPSRIPGFVPLSRGDTSRMASEMFGYVHERTDGGLTEDEIINRGWGYSTDFRFFGRLIVPIRMGGEVVQYVARSIYDGLLPKEKSGPVADGWWGKDRIVFGFDGIATGGKLCLVEGLWDWARVLCANHFVSVVSLLGSSMSAEVAGRIVRKKPCSIYVFLDGDEPGERATMEVVLLLMKRKAERIYVVRPPEDKDPDDCGAQEIKDMSRDAVPGHKWLASKSGQMALKFKKS